MLALDTNVLVRLITNDDPAQAQRLQDALDVELAAGRECLVGHIVLCELVWVLGRLYGYSVAQCQQTMASLLGFAGLRFESMPTVVAAFKAWQREGGDWADHLIGAQSVIWSDNRCTSKILNNICQITLHPLLNKD